MTLEKFKFWAELREPNINLEAWYIQSSFDFASKTARLVFPYLEEFAEDYLFNLALHLVIMTPSQDNSLFYKYFPDSDQNDPRLKAIGGFASSVSDSTSSVTNLAYEGLNRMNIADAMLMKTPYGASVKVFNDSLRHAVVVY